MATVPDPQALQSLLLLHRGSGGSSIATITDELASPLASSASSTRSGYSLSARSTEESGPPTPVHGPPHNYDRVAAQLYRSSFPRACNFEHLNGLALKTVMYV